MCEGCSCCVQSTVVVQSCSGSWHTCEDEQIFLIILDNDFNAASWKQTNIYQ